MHSSIGALASAPIKLCILGVQVYIAFSYLIIYLVEAMYTWTQVYLAWLGHLQVPQLSYVYLDFSILLTKYT